MRNFSKWLSTLRDRNTDMTQSHRLFKHRQLKAMLPLFSTSLGTDTEQTDPCDYILTERACVCMCLHAQMYCLHVCACVLAAHFLFCFFHGCCGKIAGDLCVTQPSFGEPATPGGSDWKHCWMTAMKGREDALLISEDQHSEIVCIFKGKKVTSHSLLNVKNSILKEELRKCSIVSLSCWQPFSGSICNSLQLVPISSRHENLDLCLCWIFIQAGKKMIKRQASL